MCIQIMWRIDAPSDSRAQVVGQHPVVSNINDDRTFLHRTETIQVWLANQRVIAAIYVKLTRCKVIFAWKTQNQFSIGVQKLVRRHSETECNEIIVGETCFESLTASRAIGIEARMRRDNTNWQ